MKSSDSLASDAHRAVTPPVPISEQASPRDQFALAEYNNLRMEILQLIDMESRLLNVAVIAFGAIVSIGFQTENAAIIAVHPVLALILGICWLNHNYAIVRAADYIRTRLETRFYENGRGGWEHYILGYKVSHARIARLGERAIFPGSSIAAVLAAVYVDHDDPWSIAAIAAATVVTLATILLFLVYNDGGFTRSAPGREAGKAAAGSLRTDDKLEFDQSPPTDINTGRNQPPSVQQSTGGSLLHAPWRPLLTRVRSRWRRRSRSTQ